MLLTEFVECYALSKTLSPEYVGLLRTTARQFTAHVGEPITLNYFSKSNVAAINEWLSDLERQSAVTAANKRRHLRTLWIAAHGDGLAEAPAKIRSIKVPRKIPEGLDDSQMRAVLKAADGLTGWFNNTAVPRRTYWRSLFLAGWDTALRLSDLRSVERDWIWPGGFFSIVQHKTGNSIKRQLSPQSLEAIDLLCGGRTTGLIWGTLNDKNFYRALKQLSETAGVKIGFKLIRAGSASCVERDNPGLGWRHLGHVKPGIDVAHYLVPRICAPQPTMGPTIGPPPLDNQ